MATDAATVTIRPVRRADREAWARMRRVLFPDFDPPEIDRFFDNGHFDGFEQSAVLIAESEGVPAGFAEATTRPYADGCATTPIAYLEAWFVEPGFRGRGVGAALVGAVEDWGRSLGLSEIASDTEVTNHRSQKAHAALGFEEADRIVCFTKRL